MLIRRFCFGYEIGNMHVYIIIIIIIITRYSPMRVYYFVSVLREKNKIRKPFQGRRLCATLAPHRFALVIRSGPVRAHTTTTRGDGKRKVTGNIIIII